MKIHGTNLLRHAGASHLAFRNGIRCISWVYDSHRNAQTAEKARVNAIRAAHYARIALALHRGSQLDRYRILPYGGYHAA